MTLSLFLAELRQSFTGWLFVLAALTVFELFNRRGDETLRTRAHGAPRIRWRPSWAPGPGSPHRR